MAILNVYVIFFFQSINSCFQLLIPSYCFTKYNLLHLLSFFEQCDSSRPLYFNPFPESHLPQLLSSLHDQYPANYFPSIFF